MTEDTGAREGYLVIADIAGYTKFLTGTELEHAQGIIGELTRLIIERLAPPLTFVKLEGDAVFAYAGAARFTHAERLVETVESCYIAFSDRLLDMQRSTTCRCAACASMGDLDLKFVCHKGEFVVHDAGGRPDLAGADVILVHRLLKNGITEATGVRAYAFFTAPIMRDLPDAFALPAHFETYESLGEVGGGVHDLRAVCEDVRAQRRVYIERGEADWETTMRINAPPSVVWQYWSDPEKRLMWSDMTAVADTGNDRGRRGVGATSHCAHGNWSSLTEYTDWRPFEYFSVKRSITQTSFMAAPPSTETVEFVPVDGGTDVRFRIKCDDRLGRIRVRIMGWQVRRMFAAQAARLNEILAQEAATPRPAEVQPEPVRR